MKRISDRSGTSARSETQAQLGDLAARASLVEGLVLAAEANPIVDKFGVIQSNPAFMHASQTLQTTIYPEVIELTRNMMGGSLIQLPSSAADFANPEIAADMARYVRWPGVDAEERVKLLKLLWDLISFEFGGRHLQYELFYAGAPPVVKGRVFRAYNWADVERLVDQCLASFDLST